MSEFRTGRPPTWRVMIYVFIAMAIPVYFTYPRLHTLSPTLKVVFWIYIFGVGLMPIYFGVFLPWVAKRKRTWIVEHQTLKNLYLPEFILTPNDYGWSAQLPGAPRLFGQEVFLEIHTRLIPSEPKVLPPVSRSQASLVRSLIPALPSILQLVERELMAYNQKHAPDFLAVIRHPHIWLNSECDDGGSWTFVVGRTDNPDFGYDLEFRGTELIKLCAGD